MYIYIKCDNFSLTLLYMTPDQKKLLEDIYYNKKNFVGRDKLYTLTTEHLNHPTKSQVAEWLKEQETWQLHFKPKKSTSISPIVMSKPNIYYQMDIIDMGDNASHGKRYILTLIDTFTKQAFVVALNKKNTESVLKGFKTLLNELSKSDKSIKVLQTDNGGEFINAKMKKFLKEKNIKLNTGIPGRPQAQGIIERFNGTLKDYIQKDKTATGKKQWPVYLQQYVNNYNNSYHSTIKTSPNKAIEIPHTVARNIKQRAVSKKLVRINKLKVGDKVRVKIFKGKLDKSSSQNFSKSIYTIYRVVNSKTPFRATTYRINNSQGSIIKNLYTANDLLKISKVSKPPDSVNSGSKTYKRRTKTKITPFQIVTRSKSKLANNK